MAGLTTQGLSIERLPEVLDGYNSRADQIFADLVPVGDVVDKSAVTTLGRLIGLVAPADASLWEAIQQVHDSFNPNTAQGFALDNIVALSGINRLQAQPTRAQVLLEGTRNTIVSALGKMASSSSQKKFTISAPVTLNPTNCSAAGISILSVANNTTYTLSYSSDGVTFITASINSGVSATSATILAALKAYVDANWTDFTTYYKNDLLYVERSNPFQVVTFTATGNISIDKVIKPGLALGDEIGDFPQEAFTIDLISVPIVGWDAVINPLAATTGRYQETDEELRERFRNSKFFQSANILESLIDALVNVPGVEDVVVYENDTDITDSKGIPEHSFLPIVLGGLPSDIVQAIWENKPTGILSYGDTTVPVIDSLNIAHNISFKIPTQVPIYLSVNVTDIGGMPGDVIAQIQQAVLDYSKDIYKIGDDVIYSRFYTPVQQISGFQVNSLTIGTAPSPVGTSNIAIDFDEVATFSASNIVVTIS